MSSVTCPLKPASGRAPGFVFDFFRFIEIAEDFFRCADGLLKNVVQVGEALGRLIEEKQREQEAHEVFSFDLMVLDFVAAEPEQADEGDGAHHLDKRRRYPLNEHVAEIDAEKAVGGVAETAAFILFGAEGFDYLMAGDGFLQHLIEIAHGFLGFSARAANAFA